MITRRHFLASASASAGVLALTACGRPAPVAMGPDGRPLPVLYRIDPADAPAVRVRALDRVNAARAAAGAAPLRLDPGLGIAAAAHARDIARHGLRGHTGTDGSLPVERALRAGYPGTVLGEAIAESYESELDTIAAWVAQPDTRDVVMDPAARDLGLGFHQDAAGKIWWTLMVGDGAAG